MVSIPVSKKNKMPLKSALEKSLAIFEETGHYAGLRKLKLKDQDVIKWELLFSRLQSIAIGSQEVGSKVACSPATREVGESVLGIYTAEGDAVAFSGGIMVHVRTMSRFIKWMIANDYESSPGFKHGDIFENNDSFVGGAHLPDIMDVTPIFHEGELIGWAGMVTHAMEVGGITPGSMPMLASERFTEGLIVSAERIGENDEIYNYYDVRVERSVRAPAMWIMDTKARVTGIQIARDEVLATIAEFGIEYLTAATREYIESARLTQLERVKTMLVPGTYKEVTSNAQQMAGQLGLGPLADGDVATICPVEMKIDASGRMALDLQGAGSWRYWANNATPAALEGGLFVSLSQLLNYDGRLNHGSYLGLEVKFPKGTFVWPENPYVSTSLSWGQVMPTWANWYRMMARSFFMRGFVEEVFLVGGVTPCYDAGGIDQYGNVSGMTNFELSAQGSGARGICDGIDCGYVLWNPESDMGNAEIWEMVFPQVYLGRKMLPNAHGFGKYRGGNGWQSLLLTHGTQQMVVTSTLANARVFDHQGLFGGYPGKNHYIYVMRKTDIAAAIAAKRPLPTGEGPDPRKPELLELVKGESAIYHGNCTAGQPLKDDDLLLMQYRGFGGFGDPIERKIEAIEKDLENGIVTPDMVDGICGTVTERDEKEQRYRVDPARTEKRRAAMREARKRRGVPAKAWIAKERQRVLERRLPATVLEIYKDVESHAASWMAEFREFWGLDASYTFQLPEIRDVNPIAKRFGESRVAEELFDA